METFFVIIVSNKKNSSEIYKWLTVLMNECRLLQIWSNLFINTKKINCFT